MGVFARFLRRSQGKEEASTVEVPTESPTAESGPDAEEAKGSSAAGTKAEAEPTAAADAEKNTAESVEIPKQQSADEAADNEAGEGARK
ncbi:hypothetical protein [Streptomyces jeddahensis]|uniref:Gliding motility protein n=1 Tax=Streptomyces jeddahensis TaxID=1716141 RepID=A0A177HVF2_9ACTN|nr:hypothetical protein [Streptomyces jeddahensis]OAH14696.1 hypothetical protein STSP_19570 [Streptomyces jeddahensis]